MHNGYYRSSKSTKKSLASAYSFCIQNLQIATIFFKDTYSCSRCANSYLSILLIGICGIGWIEFIAAVVDGCKKIKIKWYSVNNTYYFNEVYYKIKNEINGVL